MDRATPPSPQQRASAFWKAYFAKFRRRVDDRETSETQPAPLSASPLAATGQVERRKPRPARADAPN